jgi:eukaryotic-like serine/threonine-protein kinase
MATTSRQIRVFVSSPSDARLERGRLERVVERLNGELQGTVQLTAVRWETEFYRAHETFQAQIPEAAHCDIVVAIFRGRLGTELPPDFPTMPDGRPYPSGTAYEILSAIEASKGQGFPDVYVFRFPQPPTVQLEDPERADIESQWDYLKAFFDHWFQATDGRFKAAFQTFSSTDDFEAQIESLLRKWLEDKILHGRSVVWPIDFKGSPFRGLASFGAKHSAVFFGRNRDLAKAVDRLKDAAGNGCSFLLIDGGSGAGKSSLVRAGLVPRLTASGVVPSVDVWRVAVMRPGAVSGDPFGSLAAALFVGAEAMPDFEQGRPVALPELQAGDFAQPAELAALLAHADQTAVKPIAGALAVIEAAEQKHQGYDRPVNAMLLLVVDQLDELFDAQTSDDARNRFATLLAILSRSGKVWVVATLRADLFDRFLAQAELRRLKEEGASYDLAPPDAAELAEIVRGPAAAADLIYETDSATGERLDERLLKDADRPDLLPLLQFTLNQLFEARETVAGETRLTFAAYRALGGLEGAVDKEAENALGQLDEAARAQLPRLLRHLAAPARDEAGTGRSGYDIRSVPLPEVTHNPASAQLVNALVDARILLSAGDGQRATIRLAHARVLSSWQRAKAIVDKNADFYRIRGEVDEQRRRWEAARRSRDLLLGRGRPLAEAESIVRRFPEELPPATRDFIRQSGRRARLFQTFTAAAAVLFAIVAVGAGFAAVQAFRARNAAIVAQRQADEARQKADDRRHQAEQGIAAADEILDSAGKIQEYRSCLAATDRVAAAFPSPKASKDFFVGTWHVVQPGSSTYMDWRADGTCQFKAVTQGERSQDYQNATCTWRYEKISDKEFVIDSQTNAGEDFVKRLRFEILSYNRIHNLDIDYDGIRIVCPAAEAQLYQAELARRLQAVSEDPKDPTRSEAVADMYDRIGESLTAQGKFTDATEAYSNALATLRKLIEMQQDKTDWQVELAAIDVRQGDAFSAAGNTSAALACYGDAVAIMTKLAAADKSNAPSQHELAVDDTRVGDALARIGERSKALDAYKEGLAVLQSLGEAQPDNAELQIDIAVEYYRVSTVSDGGDAKTALTSGLHIVERLDSQHKLPEGRQSFPFLFRRELDKLAQAAK